MTTKTLTASNLTTSPLWINLASKVIETTEVTTCGHPGTVVKMENGRFALVVDGDVQGSWYVTARGQARELLADGTRNWKKSGSMRGYFASYMFVTYSANKMHTTCALVLAQDLGIELACE